MSATGIIGLISFTDNISSHRLVKPILLILVVKNLSVYEVLNSFLSKTVQELTPKIVLWDFQRVFLEAQ